MRTRFRYFPIFISRNSFLNKTCPRTRAPNYDLHSQRSPQIHCRTCACEIMASRGMQLRWYSSKSSCVLSGCSSGPDIERSNPHPLLWQTLGWQSWQTTLDVVNVDGREGTGGCASKRGDRGGGEGWHQARQDGSDSRRWHLPACLS